MDVVCYGNCVFGSNIASRCSEYTRIYGTIKKIWRYILYFNISKKYRTTMKNRKICSLSHSKRKNPLMQKRLPALISGSGAQASKPTPPDAYRSSAKRYAAPSSP